MSQDSHQRAKERFEDARDAFRDQRLRMLEDLRFSNPADPKQWEDDALNARKGRVCLTLDRTNQYIGQIVNNARKNKPAIEVLPVDSGADVQVATRMGGIIRHIEYRSRAAIAYDTGIEHAARVGLGWWRVVPEIIHADTNEQDIVIKRVHDPLSITPDVDWCEPDGADLREVWAETTLSQAAFKRQFPKAKASNWETDGTWVMEDGIRVCEYQYVEESEKNQLVVADPEGETLTLSEDDYWLLARQIGYQPKVVEQFMGKERTVKWCKLNGVEVLEETVYPSKWVGFVPVVGFELWIEGKRFMCGATRRMRDGQRAYNYERSAGTEAVASQPKAPVMTPFEAVAGHEKHWDRMNSGNPAYLPYNHVDDNGNPIPPPNRLSPPQYPAAFAQAGAMALQDMEAAIGMFQSNMGAPNNATSGKQERERKEQGDTATYHFADNQGRSIEHTGRIVVDMMPRLYDTKRQARILGIDGKNDRIDIDPDGPAVQRQNGKIVSINLGVGTYDVRVSAGTNYTTQRQEAAEGIVQILQAAPEFAAVLAPTLVKLRDWPEAEKVSRMLLAMAPPQIQEIANEGQNGEEPIPPHVRSKMQALELNLKEAEAMLDAGEQELQRMGQENESLKADKSIETMKLAAQVESDEVGEAAALKKLDIEAFRADTERMKAGADATTADRTASDRANLAKQPAKPAKASAPAPSAPQEEPAGVTQLAEATKAMLEQQAQTISLLETLIRVVQAPRTRQPIYDKDGEMTGSRETIDLPTLQ